MTGNTQGSVEVEDLAKRAHQLRAKAEEMWTWDPQRLDDAQFELNIDLNSFCSDLDRNPVFAQMPNLEGDYEYLWALFLQWGDPQAEAWNNECIADGNGLGGLPVQGFFIALAFLEAKRAASGLAAYGECLREGKLPEAEDELTFVRGSIKSGEKAVRFLEEHPL